MLSQLTIRNLALIDALTLDLDAGLNVVTGETGAGKSIIIGAMQMLLGERVDRSLIRAGADRAEVSGILQLDDPAILAAVDAILDAAGAPTCDDGQLLLGRVITDKTVKNVANATPVTAQILKAIGDQLVDVHGPYDHQSLLRPARQLDVLDAYIHAADARATLATAWADLRDARQALATATAEVPSADAIDILKFQLAEIDRAALDPREEADITARHALVANAQELIETLAAARSLIYDADGAVIEQLGHLHRSLDSLARIDPDATATFTGLLDSAIADLQTLADEIAHYMDRIDADPKALDQLDARLALYQRLKRKYGGSVDSTLAYAAEAKAKLDRMQHHDRHLQTLRDHADSRETALRDHAASLSSKRRRAARKLARAVESKLHLLGFPQAEFGIDLTTAELGPSGIDAIEFQFGPNPGEPQRPLRQIASSGEISRVMLALKTVLAEADQTPILIFDEVDANIGGQVATRVGAALRALSRGRQIICITHQPQVAAGADQHYRVEKKVAKKRTTTALTLLDDAERLAELARMLGGDAASSSSAATRHARELIDQLAKT